jgi:hypothetical protein
MTQITEAELQSLYDYPKHTALVSGGLGEAVRTIEGLVRFLGRYASWNGYFGSGVATLAGKIGSNRRLFEDPSEPIKALADRSVLVASFFFDAARDEFDDRDTAHRDTHRCLAQAMVGGLIAFGRERGTEAEIRRFSSAEWVNALLADPLWLGPLRDRVRAGYGASSGDDLPSLFRCFGYHLGSEVLADQEFSILDECLRIQQAELTQFLKTRKIRIADEEHSAYQWLSIHSGHGGGAEAEHFAWAVRGVHYAYRYVPVQLHEALRRQVHRGFLDFAHDHREFFERANEVSLE